MRPTFLRGGAASPTELLSTHRRGKDAKDVLRVLERIASQDGDELAGELARLKDLAIAGKL
jgi:hypothetical protein